MVGVFTIKTNLMVANKKILKLDSNFSSPKNIKNPHLFTKRSLISLIEAWNENKDEKIIYKTTFSIAKLSELLNEKIKPICDDKQYWCWTGALKSLSKDSKTKEIIKVIENTELRPEMPIKWTKNPIEWLDNYDIEDVMIQYNNDKKYKYAFLGVFPIDFSEEDKFGRCLYSKICSIDIKKYINKKIKYIGLITNLDKHDQSGSHWTSTFIIIDPKNKCYGAHYYDSNAMKIPSYINKFINTIKTNLSIIYPNIKFNITFNKKRHQMKNTECGMFSLSYQIRWLNSIIKYKELNISSPYEDCNFYNHIVNDSNITDDNMEKTRSYLFRPNIKVYLKDKNITI